MTIRADSCRASVLPWALAVSCLAGWLCAGCSSTSGGGDGDDALTVDVSGPPDAGRRDAPGPADLPVVPPDGPLPVDGPVPPPDVPVPPPDVPLPVDVPVPPPDVPLPVDVPVPPPDVPLPSDGPVAPPDVPVPVDVPVAPPDVPVAPPDVPVPVDVPVAPPDVPVAPPDVPVAPPDVPVAPPDVPVAPPDVPLPVDVPVPPPDVPPPVDVPVPPPDVPPPVDVPVAPPDVPLPGDVPGPPPDVPLSVDVPVAPSDLTAPTWPDAWLATTDVGSTSVTVAWSAAADDTAVVAYRLFVDGARVSEVDGATWTQRVGGLRRETEYVLRVEAGDAAGNWSQDGPSTTVVTSALPPDPVEVAPPVDPTVPTRFAASVAFLWEGDDALQSDVAPDAIEDRRVSVLRGVVTDETGAPLPGAYVTTPRQPDAGWTLSREDGAFDLAANGGGRLTVEIRHEDYLPAWRTADVPFHAFVWLGEVQLVALDPAATVVALGDPEVQVASGAPIVDADGARTPTVLVPGGTTADLVFADGTRRSAPVLTLRVTEYTVGAEGPRRMPAPLPVTSRYTHAVELSADEAAAEGATRVEFSAPLFYYVENFVGFPVGGAVPLGTWDAARERWIASPDGRVIEVLAVVDGRAAVDADGDGLADGDAALAALGLGAAERAVLAARYAAGTTLWRSPIPHLSAWDCNWPGIFPDGSGRPETDPPGDGDTEIDPCEQPGSIVACESQTFREVVQVPGLPFALVYSSRHQAGYTAGREVRIPLSGVTMPTEWPERFELHIDIAGRHLEQSFVPAPDRVTTWRWDGNDVYGRPVQGLRTALIDVRYVYPLTYVAPASQVPSFGRTGDGAPLLSSDRAEVSVGRSYRQALGGFDARGAGLGGWTPSIQHTFDPAAGVLFLGDGRQRRATGAVVQTVAGGGTDRTGEAVPATSADLRTLRHLAAGPDGTIYVAEGDAVQSRVRAIAPDGTIRTLGGRWSPGCTGDGGPARSGTMSPFGLAVGPDGSVYVAERSCQQVRRIAPDGTLQRVAGTVQSAGYSGDGGPALAARLSNPSALAFGPDGALYVADHGNYAVRRIDLDTGVIDTAVGGNGRGSAGDGGPARAAQLANPFDVAFGPDGTLYVTTDDASRDEQRRVRAVGPDGLVRRVAGGVDGDPTEGALAADSAFGRLFALTTDPSGNLYLAHTGVRDDTVVRNKLLLRIDPDGRLARLGGLYDSYGASGDGGLATQAGFAGLDGIVHGPDGALYVSGGGRVRRVATDLTATATPAGEYLVPSGRGDSVYAFAPDGRHDRTFDAVTGRTLWTFAYDGAGRLTAVSDTLGRTTTIERDAGGAVTALVPPGGARVALTLDDQGYLAELRRADGAAVAATYHPGGLLETFTDFRGNGATYEYDDLGRLVAEENRAGGQAGLARVEDRRGATVTASDPAGRETAYHFAPQPDGTTWRTKVAPSGAVSESTTGIDGTVVATTSLGETIVVRTTSDPLLGSYAAAPTSYEVTTPGGLTRRIDFTRTVELGNAAHPLRLARRTETVDRGGAVSTTVIDLVAGQVTRTSAAGVESVLTLDAQGRVTSWRLAQGLDPIEYAWDESGRLASIAHGDLRWAPTYDAAGRVEAVTNGAGETVQRGWDEGGNVSAFSLPEGEGFDLARDGNGNLAGVTTPEGGVHGLPYSALDGPTGHVPPGGAGNTTLRATDDRITEMRHPSGRAIVHEALPDGRASALRYPEAATTLEYADATDRPARFLWTPVVGDPQALDLAWDGALVTGLAWSGPATGDYVFRHDDDFQVVGVTLDGGPERVLTHDPDGRVTADGPLTFVRGGPGGRVSQIGDGVLAVDYAYDTLGRLSRRVHSVGAVPFYDLALEYDPAGRVATTIEVEGGRTLTRDYVYDLDGQLREVWTDGARSERYEYDGDGNRTARTLGAGAREVATYDGQGRLRQQGATAYGFDEDGYLATRGGVTFTHSARGELLATSQGVAYGYDGLRRRVFREAPDGTATVWLYGGSRDERLVTATKTAAGTTTLFYDDAGVLLALSSGGAWTYVATDAVGSPRVAVAADGTVLRRLEYDAFGRVAADSDPTVDLPLGFAGGLPDAQTGLVNFWLRDYDPDAGRFVARDPLRFHGGLNHYAYAANDPVSRRDPNGLGMVKFDAFLGAGLSVELYRTAEGWAYCTKPGVGIGAGVGVDLFAGLPRESFTVVDYNVGASLGEVGLAAGLTIEYVLCQDGRIVPRPTERSVTIGYGVGEVEVGLGPDVEIAPGFGLDLGAGVSLTVGVCRVFTNPW
jgi:RHS repeat-associated protein